MSVLAMFDPAVDVLHDVLLSTSHALPGPVPFQLAAAVALLTVAVRLTLLPLAIHAFRGQQARAALAPEIARLRSTHQDRERLAREISSAHQRAGVSPVAGLDASLLMAPVFLVLVRAVHLIGPPLSTHWLPLLAASGPLSTPALLFALLTGALLAVAWLSSRQQPAGPARVFPYVTVVIATLAPAAVSVYLLSTTAWTVAERALLPHLLG